MTFKTPMLMTPGPTAINERVRHAAARPITNPDLDARYFQYHGVVLDRLKTLFKTQNDVVVLSGEAILGLEAACASLIEPGDRVLCIDNGVFGKGFGDFAKMYGAEVVTLKADYRKAVTEEVLESFLEDDHHFKLATLVHCETPSGITNPVDKLCPLLSRYGILSVVDAVSALGGEELETDAWEMDVVIAGTQKCLSAAPGLTLMSIGEKAWHHMENRQTPFPGFYTNLTLFKNCVADQWFPYTQPISAIYQLDEAVQVLLEDGRFVARHREMAEAVRGSFEKAGLELYAQEGHANTVTTVMVPSEIAFETLFNTLVNDYGIMIGGGIDYLKGHVFRIGHMGEGCSEENLYKTLKALNTVFTKAGVPLEAPLHTTFETLIQQE